MVPWNVHAVLVMLNVHAAKVLAQLIAPFCKQWTIGLSTYLQKERTRREKGRGGGGGGGGGKGKAVQAFGWSSWTDLSEGCFSLVFVSAASTIHFRSVGSLTYMVLHRPINWRSGEDFLLDVMVHSYHWILDVSEKPCLWPCSFPWSWARHWALTGLQLQLPNGF